MQGLCYCLPREFHSLPLPVQALLCHLHGNELSYLFQMPETNSTRTTFSQRTNTLNKRLPLGASMKTTRLISSSQGTFIIHPPTSLPTTSFYIYITKPHYSLPYNPLSSASSSVNFNVKDLQIKSCCADLASEF